MYLFATMSSFENTTSKNHFLQTRGDNEISPRNVHADTISEGIIFSTLNDLLLQVGVHIVEIIAVSGHAHQQILVVFRALPSRQKGCGVDNIKLDMVTAEGKIGADKLAEFFVYLCPVSRDWAKNAGSTGCRRISPGRACPAIGSPSRDR